MNNQLTPTDLMQQANKTAESYFHAAIRVIDEKFGQGYAQEHPQLIGDFMKTAAQDFDTCMQRQVLDNLATDFNRLVDEISIIVELQSPIDSSDISKLCDQLEESNNSIAGSIDSIATSINSLSSSIDRFLPPVEEFITFMPRGRK